MAVLGELKSIMDRVWGCKMHKGSLGGCLLAVVLCLPVMLAISHSAQGQSAQGRSPHWQPGVAVSSFESGDQADIDFASTEGYAPGVYGSDGNAGSWAAGDPAGSAFYEAGESFAGESCSAGGAGMGCQGYLAGRPQWSAGVEFTILRPYFENNAAFTLLESDGGTVENFSDTQFDYRQELAPRVWVEVLGSSALGLRHLLAV